MSQCLTNRSIGTPIEKSRGSHIMSFAMWWRSAVCQYWRLWLSFQLNISIFSVRNLNTFHQDRQKPLFRYFSIRRRNIQVMNTRNTSCLLAFKTIHCLPSSCRTILSCRKFTLNPHKPRPVNVNINISRVKLAFLMFSCLSPHQARLSSSIDSHFSGGSYPLWMIAKNRSWYQTFNFKARGT